MSCVALTWWQIGEQECRASQLGEVCLSLSHTLVQPSEAPLPRPHGFLLGKGLLQLVLYMPLPEVMCKAIQQKVS